MPVLTSHPHAEPALMRGTERPAQAVASTLCAALGLLIAAPLLALLAWLIRLDDGGPVLFTQMRVGAARRPFRIIKLRTMRQGRVTRVGRWLRATGLDEVPQLWNVLRGDMALVGPRPLTAEDLERLGWNDAAHAQRFSCLPGVIGLAQLYAGRGKRLSWFLDATYVQHREARMDAGIVIATAAVAWVGKRRVRRALRSLRRIRRRVDRRLVGRWLVGRRLATATAGTPRQSGRSSSSGNRLGASISAN